KKIIQLKFRKAEQSNFSSNKPLRIRMYNIECKDSNTKKGDSAKST
ncbi:MAG: hypothetical protein ACI9V8_001600, partial [Urechidicola sp.]